MQQLNTALFREAVRMLCSRVSRYAYCGLAIAVCIIVSATVATVLLNGQPLTLANLYTAQRDDISLLILNGLPFIFALWGQYVGVVLSSGVRRVSAPDSYREVSSDETRPESEVYRPGELDALTGLLNRTGFLQRLETVIAAAFLSRARVGLVVLDLDGFSEVNDRFGSANGDRVLKCIARRLRVATDERASIARLGGDNFAVIVDALPSPTMLEATARRIEQGLEPPCMLDGLVLNLAASLGGAVYPDSTCDAHALLNAADGAMQHAKTRGGGFQLVKAREPLHDAEMYSLSAELRSAIDDDQLVLHFQPIVDMAADHVHGVEALVRWQHPRRGLIMPGDFIPRAERSGLMRELTNWVLLRSLQHAANLHASGSPLKISVNLSARSLLDPSFPDALADLLAAFDLPSEFLTLEITEDTLMADQRRTLDIATRISNMGVQISIDDFGTGYSQLAYLKRLPATEVKIDRSFVADMLASRTDRSIVEATIGLAHALGLQVVGEGIENESQAEKLNELGCDLMQGYYIGRPMPIEQLQQWLDQRRMEQQSRSVEAARRYIEG